jgi:hypothetical protein
LKVVEGLALGRGRDGLRPGFAGSELCVEQSWTEYGEKLKKVDFLRAMDRLNKMEGD